MPTTMHGLSEVGLAEWPAWYRSLNPGYFVDQDRAQQTRLTKGRGRSCVHGAGGCCSARGNGETLRIGGWNARVGGRRGPRSGEEVAEQIVARLRGMERERGQVKESVKEREVALIAESEKSSANATIERTVVRDAKD